MLSPARVSSRNVQPRARAGDLSSWLCCARPLRAAPRVRHRLLQACASVRVLRLLNALRLLCALRLLRVPLALLRVLLRVALMLRLQYALRLRRALRMLRLWCVLHKLRLRSV